MYRNSRLRRFSSGGFLPNDTIDLSQISDIGSVLLQNHAYKKGWIDSDYKYLEEGNKPVDTWLNATYIGKQTDPLVANALSMVPGYGHIASAIYKTANTLLQSTGQVESYTDPYGNKTYAEKKLGMTMNPFKFMANIANYGKRGIDLMRIGNIKDGAKNILSGVLYANTLGLSGLSDPFDIQANIANEERKRVDALWQGHYNTLDQRQQGLMNTANAFRREQNAMQLSPFKVAKGGRWIQKATKKMKEKGTVGSFREYCLRKGFESATKECVALGLRSPNEKIRKKAQFVHNINQ